MWVKHCPLCFYACVSSESEDVDLSICDQLKTLRKHAANRGSTVASEYVDEARIAKADRR
jgi:hypothetical protein